jgi:hypothetical protein
MNTLPFAAYAYSPHYAFANTWVVMFCTTYTGRDFTLRWHTRILMLNHTSLLKAYQQARSCSKDTGFPVFADIRNQSPVTETQISVMRKANAAILGKR